MYQLELWQRSIWQKDTRFTKLNCVTTSAFPCVLRLCYALVVRGVARQDLFGNWIVKKTWGSAVKIDFGRSNSIVCPDYQTGLVEYQKHISKRIQRGYTN